MTKEEAIKVIEDGDWWDSYITESTIEGINADDELHEALDLALAALRPVSRERVEQTWSGRWIEKDGFGRCSACGWGVDYFEGGGGERFCSGCGRAMTDEAVDIVLRRLEAMQNETG